MVDENELLSKWYDLKETISKLEIKLDEFKSHANDIMESRKTDTISNEKFVLQKREMTRRNITKNDLPEHIWQQFSKETVCSAFYLTKKGEKRKSPSTKRRFRSPKNNNEKFCR
jgi:hypothetical protein